MAVTELKLTLQFHALAVSHDNTVQLSSLPNKQYVFGPRLLAQYVCGV